MWTLTTPVLPCPFCGGRDILALDIAQPLSMLQCRTCQAQGPIGESHEASEAAWQTRGVPPEQTCWQCRQRFHPREPGQRYCQAACEAQAVIMAETALELRNTLIEAERTKRERQQATRAAKRQQRAEEAEARQRAYEQYCWEMASS